MEEAGLKVQQPHPRPDTGRWMLPFPGVVRFAQRNRWQRLSLKPCGTGETADWFRRF